MKAGYADLLDILAGWLCLLVVYGGSLALFDGCLCKLLFFGWLAMLVLSRGYAAYAGLLCWLDMLALLHGYTGHICCLISL
jgi:hypothetical protein